MFTKQPEPRRDRYTRRVVSYAPQDARVGVADGTRPFGGEVIAWAYSSEADRIIGALNERDRLRDALGLLRGYVGGLNTEGMRIINEALDLS